MRTRLIIWLELVVLVILTAVCLVLIYRRLGEEEERAVSGKEEAEYREAERQEEDQEDRTEKEMVIKSALEECYRTFLAGRGEELPAANMAESHRDFAEWVIGNYPEQADTLFARARGGNLTPRALYEILGETMQVLTDRQKGYLADEATAKRHQIYLKEGRAEKEAQVLVGGDLCFAEDGFVLDYYDEVNDLSQCISPELLDMTNNADLFYLNHEYCVSSRGEPLKGKYYTFRAKPKRMELLNQMGTGLVSLANNHVYDYGRKAMLDTVDYLEQAGIPYVGGGRNEEEAERPVYFIINGIKIGFVAASNAEKMRYTPAATQDSPGILEAYDTAEYERVIRGAAKECDYLVAYIHWGTEDVNQYNSLQTEQGKKFLDSGADIVVGGHPHVLQGIEYVEGKPIVYSMGDFWFNHETKYTGLLRLRITYEGLEEMSFVPCLQTKYTTQYLKESSEQGELYAFLQKLSPNVLIDAQGVIAEKKEAGDTSVSFDNAVP